MRQAKILYKDINAGILTQHDDGFFIFQYNEVWINDSNKPHISPTLPKQYQEYRSEFLFPFFYNMLPEGSNKSAICKSNRIDEKDDFGILLTVANNDTIGAVRIIKIE